MKNEEQDRYGVVEKCRAVLAVWTERKQAAGLCRELGVSASLLSQWQDRALTGMLEALEPRGTGEGAEGPALPMPVKRLLERKVRIRDLEAVGRQPHWRGRPAKSRPLQDNPSISAGS